MTPSNLKINHIKHSIYFQEIRYDFIRMSKSKIIWTDRGHFRLTRWPSSVRTAEIFSLPQFWRDCPVSHHWYFRFGILFQDLMVIRHSWEKYLGNRMPVQFIGLIYNLSTILPLCRRRIRTLSIWWHQTIRWGTICM